MHILSSRKYLGRATEARAAKTIFHVSGWSARHWLVAVACGGWSHGNNCGNFLSLGSFQSCFGQMAARFHLSHEWRGPGGGVLHSVCGALGGPLLPRCRAFMVSHALLGLSRRPPFGSWNAHYDCRACAARAGGFFTRLSLVRPPRNCDSSLIAPTRIVSSLSSIAAPWTQARPVFPIRRFQ